MTTRTFPPETLRAIVQDELADYPVVSDEITGTGRWSVYHTAVFRDETDGTYWMTDYSVGATEYQDQDPYEYDDSVAYEVRPVETVTIVYERV
jgi:hypothetical protein